SGKSVDRGADGLLAATQALSGARLSFNAGQDDAGENFGEQYVQNRTHVRILTTPTDSRQSNVTAETVVAEEIYVAACVPVG
ncbi:hypothetical protein RA989_18160, partial [Mycobacteroides abscessus subsp. massiliense]